MLINKVDSYPQAPFSFGNRLRRLIWSGVYGLLFRPSPRIFHAWRALLLRAFGAQLGRACHVYPGARIWAPWNLVLGDHAGVADGAILYSMDRMEIGRYAVISQGAHLCGGTHDYNSANFQLIAKPIVVGAYAWVCAEAFVHAGVTVAEGVVLGARSVAQKDLAEPWAVYAGNPCKRVGGRSDMLKLANEGGTSRCVVKPSSGHS